ncbi:MAG: hypothetical protein C0618_09430 [Desulfuromonas sp.]|nr:MAG: hypothetical protein C0618_09430 [Desulfuromonas sp.]
MIVGFNHNITYRGVCFHVQTEDSGIKTPHLITLLYHGGIIISSQKTSYADILNVENLDAVVEDLAKEQHKEMLRRLKKGEFDQRIVDMGIVGADQQAEKEDSGEDPDHPASGAKPSAGGGSTPVPSAPSHPEPTVLDALIFAYLSVDDDAN